MKGKRLLAAALALSTTLTLVTGPASAVTFTDLKGHWAQQDVEYLAGLGLVKGYDDGSFKPDANMSAVEALLFCARVTTPDTTTKNAIIARWADTLKAIIGESMYAWAAPDLSMCLEMGIISPEELSALSQAGGLLSAIPREKVALYLARAMQLAPVAEGLSAYPLNFKDTDSISEEMKPYVYLLNSYGILKGDELNRFNPQTPLNRASMTSLLRRAMDFMDEQGIKVELADYTTYDWAGGVISSVNVLNGGTIQLTLTTAFDGSQTITLPAGVAVYESNMRSTGSALKPGAYARVNFSSSGTAAEVRVSGSVESFTGSVKSLKDGVLTVSSGGADRSYRVDRFTQVKVGGRSGGKELLEENAGYTAAVCRVDGLGHLASVELTGGTRQEVGLLTSVDVSGSGTGTIQVSDLSGVKTRYEISSSTGVTVNSVAGKLLSSYVGDYVTLRVSNDNPDQVSALNVDTTQQYIQVSIKGVTYAQSPNKITVTALDSTKSVTYTVGAKCDIRYNGKTTTLAKLQTGSFATLRLSGTEVSAIDAYPGSTTDTGTIASITYGIPTVLTVTREDGSSVSYELDLSDPPEIYRGGSRTTIDRLKTGDQVELTVRYNEVSAIEAKPQSANASGTISSVTIDAKGTTITVELTGGGTASYLVSEGVSVTQDGKAVAISTLKPGYKISMVVDGDQVISIEVDKNTQSANQITGTVLYVNTSAKEILLQTTDANGVTNAVTVSTSGAELRSASGSSLSLSSLETGDTVLLFGSYDGLTFRTTLLIRT